MDTYSTEQIILPPLISIGISIIPAYCLVNTKPGSTIRYAGLLVFLSSAIFTLQFILHLFKDGERGMYPGLFSAHISLLVCHWFNILFIMGLNADDLKTFGSFKSPFLKAWALAPNTRGIRTPWQTKNVPAFPAYYGTQYPSRAQFLRRQLAFVWWQWLVLDMFFSRIVAPTPEEKITIFGKGTEFVFLHATPDQMIGRVATTLTSWFFAARIFIDCFYRLISIVIVGTGLARPEDYPPVFDSEFEAYTLRKFWG
jgi:hypothetical protein